MESRVVGIPSKGEVLYDSAEVDDAIEKHFSFVLRRYKSKTSDSYRYDNLARAVYNEALRENWKIKRYAYYEDGYNKLDYLAKGMVLLAPYCSKYLQSFIKDITHISQESYAQLCDASLKYNSKQKIVPITCDKAPEDFSVEEIKEDYYVDF